MNVIDAIESRKSVRAFKADPVSKDVLLQILAAANRSPSWADTQPWASSPATRPTGKPGMRRNADAVVISGL
jgi:nitroreductase